ncbi:5-methyltetrahydropteroyltriglutamate--homocysteine S-methyltransferase [Speluncibacter jeojiensis]|uniref:5-methyltetrahydropteroyltriglutamate--homocysteine methyltransferase n=1 Tax=Speluncibacter jeojiensis TaxID=2710754 RepID=A0A9X4RDD2_9ACTN|nr:5-methyltetrahydropteroyltriglutamate--homocysteine S-methyltransferase [Corynebacteriales bacterium D3-21]
MAVTTPITTSPRSTGPAFGATVLGTPRVGPDRELKRATESYWAGAIDRTELERVAARLRSDMWAGLRAAGIDAIPVNTFSFYDQMLDTAALLGALPGRVAHIADDLDRYFAAARGTAQVAPLEMTKWFDTNYHYLVPEIAPHTAFRLDATSVLDDLDQALREGIAARPVLIGPVTFLALSKGVDGLSDPLTRLDDLVPLYRELLTHLHAAGAQWVQFDEPILVTDVSDETLDRAARLYRSLSEQQVRPSLLVATYFGDTGGALDRIAGAGVEAIAVDLVSGGLDAVTGSDALGDTLVVAGVVDGRNVWRTDLDRALARLEAVRAVAGSVAVSTSCSLLHVPYSLAAETGIDATLSSWLAFGDEKVAEVVTLATAVRDGAESIGAALSDSRAAAGQRSADPRVRNDTVRATVEAERRHRTRSTPATRRRVVQQQELGLPLLPTTTIGSYPQTTAIRVARADLRAGRIDGDEYTARMRAEIAEVVRLQEKLGLDVLVHGEPERNDMVQYFAEQLDGFFASERGWVQSYGTRCVRPPILYGDVARPDAMTVDWFRYAQSLSAKPVKGMLTGPVTILAWSFVRDDLPLADTADQVALAIRQETVDLEAAGARIVQVDEPALRELLPLRASERPRYLDWAVGAFQLATSGVADTTQIHTHLCYSEFGDVIGAIVDLDADVTSIEAARSHMEVLDDLESVGFDLGVGPGVYDIHSPRVPSVEEIVDSLGEALAVVPAERLWVNPDCGLKTRGTDEVVASLTNLVAAAKQVRAELS